MDSHIYPTSRGVHSLKFMVTMCVRRVESMTHYRVILCLKMTPFTVNSSKNIYPFTVLPFCQPLEVRSKIFIMHFFTIITFDLQTLFCKETLKMEPFSRYRTVPCLSLKITPFYRGFTDAHSFRIVLSGPPGLLRHFDYIANCQA